MDHTELLTLDRVDEQVTGDIGNLAAEDYDYQDHENNVQAPEDENEYVVANTDGSTAVPEQDTKESLDSCAAHDDDFNDSIPAAGSSSNTEPAEYEVYAEASEYDKRYGEEEQEGDDDVADSNDHHETVKVDNTQDALSEPDVVENAPTTSDPNQPKMGGQIAEKYFTGGGDEGAHSLSFVAFPLTSFSFSETFEEIHRTDAETAFHADSGTFRLLPY